MKNVAAVILINQEKKLLFCLRDNKISIPYPDYWALLGGHLENNETPIKALKRELLEEIEYELRNPLFIGTFNDKVGHKVYMYQDKIDKKIDELILHEGQKLGYFSFEEVLNIKIPPVLKDFLIKNKKKIKI